MKIQSIVVAAAIFALGAVLGHAMTLPSVQADVRVAQDVALELTRKAGNLPSESYDAI
jgi:hypothetical protein